MLKISCHDCIIGICKASSVRERDYSLSDERARGTESLGPGAAPARPGSARDATVTLYAIYCHIHVPCA